MIDSIEKILNDVRAALDELMDIINQISLGHYEAKHRLLDIYDGLFLQPVISFHIEYYVSRIAKSTYLIGVSEYTESNSYLHIVLHIKSEELEEIDAIYSERISYLLAFFREAFQVLNNLSVLTNKSKIQQWRHFIEELHTEILEFIRKSHYNQIILPRKLSVDNEASVEIVTEDNNPMLSIPHDKSAEVSSCQDISNKWLKEHWQKFDEHLKNNQVQDLYHFTDRSNLESIRKYGLCSIDFCRKNNIPIGRFASSIESRQSDDYKGLANFVHLSFCKDHPMAHIAKRKQLITDPIILKIDPSVVFWKNTKFSDKNAACRDARIDDNFQFFCSMDIALCKRKYFDIKDDRAKKEAYQAEILVHEKIPIEFIRGL
jgi:hypothetical protein